jgi:hypothetical protein
MCDGFWCITIGQILAPAATTLLIFVTIWLAEKSRMNSEAKLSRTLAETTKESDRTRALSTYSDFLKLCLDHPEMAMGDSYSGNISDPLHVEPKYRWFLGFMAMSLEALLMFSRDDEWHAVACAHLDRHKTSLRKLSNPEMGGQSDYFSVYSEEFRAVLQQVLTRAVAVGGPPR